MSTSTIPAFKADLVARLQADGGLSGVNVVYGPPQPSVLAGDEWVGVGNVSTNQIAAALGQLRREEVYTVDVVVLVQGRDRNSHQTLTERAYTIAGVVETSVRTWTSIFADNGAILAEIVGLDLEEGEAVAAAGRASQVTVRVQVTARI